MTPPSQQQPSSQSKLEAWHIVMGAIAVVVIFALVLWLVPGDKASTDKAINQLKIATGFTLLTLVFLFGFAVLISIANGTIDLSDLLSETGANKGASMSRFQLLIFTLVIALSLFLVTVANMAFPTSLPPEILTLLGISATTYAVSKGIQASANPSSTDTTSGGPTTPAPGTTTSTPPATPAAKSPGAGGGNGA